MDSVKCCNWSALSLSHNVPLSWLREVGGPPRRSEAPTGSSSGGETSRTETLGPRGDVVDPLWPPAAPPPDRRVLLLPLLPRCHVGEDTEDGVADLVCLRSIIWLLVEDLENYF